MYFVNQKEDENSLINKKVAKCHESFNSLFFKIRYIEKSEIKYEIYFKGSERCIFLAIVTRRDMMIKDIKIDNLELNHQHVAFLEIS